MFRYPSLRGVVANENPGWEGVPRGCSIQIGSLGADNSPHFNGNKYSKGQRGLLGTGTGDFATQAEFQSICKEPSFWRPEVGGQECPAGTQISGQLACKAAYESLRDTFSAIAKRLLQSGSWSGVPRGCSAPFAGSDSTPHVNSYTGVPSGTGDWSSMCWPGRYYIPPRGATRCPTNQQVTSRSECRQALLALLPVLQAAAGRESIAHIQISQLVWALHKERTRPNHYCHSTWGSWEATTLRTSLRRGASNLSTLRAMRTAGPRLQH